MQLNARHRRAIGRTVTYPVISNVGLLRDARPPWRYARAQRC
jgi:hypothetical protein